MPLPRSARSLGLVAVICLIAPAILAACRGSAAGEGALDIETTNGKIGISGAEAAIGRARTSNRALGFAGSLAAGAQSFETSNNPIDLRLPAAAAFALDLTTSNAKIAVGYQVATAADATDSHVEGRVGTDPATAITARTTNGTIAIRPAS